MSLNGVAFLSTAIAVGLLLTLLTLVVWNRVPGPRPARVAGRLLLLGLSQAAAVLVVLVCVNDHYAFYDSWADLSGGSTPSSTRPNTGAALAGAQTGAGDLSAVFHAGERGLQVAEPVGAYSQVRGTVLVWLPPQYGEPEHAGERFPVVELLPGQPGTPVSWFTAMAGQDALNRLIGTQQARPMILVAATSNTLGGADAGCTDLPGGPRTDTWLARDVPAIVKAHFRASADPYDWSVMGYSAGGYCAVDLAVHHPEVFHSAVSISGYNDPVAGVVVNRHPELIAANSPLRVLRRRSVQPDIRLLLGGSREDGQTVGDARALLAALRAPAGGDLLTVAHGGHNMQVWQSMLPDAFRWLSRQLRQ
ncbi:alpha/beta hydrolase [Streptacidiphilus sp. EB129]|uniref:alpha/beta hydrolase n=1 Tax=Streptacidiphilus sp. EB129 TaxID=3156262 RepID=UPI00351543D5